MAELFLSYGAQKISEARQASNAADLAAVAKAAHAIKSSAGNIGASQVQDLATRMERLALEAQAEQVAALMSELEEAFARVEVELKAK